MKQGADWTSERRPPQGGTTCDDPSIIPDWATLLPELVQHIADHVLSTTAGGVDAYMDMRAVCSTWRSAIAKPSPLAAVVELRFRPRHWVMVDLKKSDSPDDDDDARLFLHGPTGRFRRLRLPVLRSHMLLAATDGLLVLGDREPPHLARVLNPFTGDVLCFPPLLHHLEDMEDLANAAVTGVPDSTTLVVWKWDMILYAAPTSHAFTVDTVSCFSSMVIFQGNIYCSDADGWIYNFVTPAEQRDDAALVLVAQVSEDVDVYTEVNYGGPSSYLVESAGELLYIRHVAQGLRVFRVDIERKLLEEVHRLGSSHALFLGHERCVSVDAGKFPSLDGGCIYYMRNSVETTPERAYSERDLRVYNPRDDMMEIIASEVHLDRPFSLVQVLLRYCDFRY